MWITDRARFIFDEDVGQSRAFSLINRAFLKCGSRTCLILLSTTGTSFAPLVCRRKSIPNVAKSARIDDAIDDTLGNEQVSVESVCTDDEDDDVGWVLALSWRVGCMAGVDESFDDDVVDVVLTNDWRVWERHIPFPVGVACWPEMLCCDSESSDGPISFLRVWERRCRVSTESRCCEEVCGLNTNGFSLGFNVRFSVLRVDCRSVALTDRFDVITSRLTHDRDESPRWGNVDSMVTVI